jgi:hypothetical protein
VAYRETSSDGYVRIPTSALHSIALRHLVSEIDPTIASIDDTTETLGVTGITEWVGSWHDMTVSVGWDWGVFQGVVIPLNPNEIRSNILLIGADGRPEPAAVTQIHLLYWIESLPWRQSGIQDLLVGKAALRK